jgi:hypothetical protein
MLFVVPIIDPCGLNPEPTHCSIGRQKSEIWHEQKPSALDGELPSDRQVLDCGTNLAVLDPLRDFGTLSKVTV